jgi:hypothetical protein
MALSYDIVQSFRYFAEGYKKKKREKRRKVHKNGTKMTILSAPKATATFTKTASIHGASTGPDRLGLIHGVRRFPEAQCPGNGQVSLPHEYE